MALVVRCFKCVNPASVLLEMTKGTVEKIRTARGARLKVNGEDAMFLCLGRIVSSIEISTTCVYQAGAYAPLTKV
jgi:hypothetical protein